MPDDLQRLQMDRRMDWAMRVLHVLERDLSSSRMRQIRRLADGLLHADVNCSLCCMSGTRTQRSQMQRFFGEHDLHLCLQTLPFDFTIVPRLVRRLRATSPDILHYWGSTLTPTLIVANRLSINAPLVATTAIGQDSLSLPCWKAGTTIVAETNAPAVSDSQPVSQFVPAGVPVSDDFRDSSISSKTKLDDANSLRTRLGLGNVKLIASSTDLVIQNRGKDLIWALDCLRVLHPDTHLVFFGEGSYRSELIRFAESVGADANVVHFVDDAGHRLPAWLQECDCFWQADATGNQGAILEAMAAQVPVVASETPESMTVVEDGETGFVVPPGDAAEFARRTNILFSAPLHRQRVIRKAYANVVRNHSIDEMVRAYLQIYRGQRMNVAGNAA